MIAAIVVIAVGLFVAPIFARAQDEPKEVTPLPGTNEEAPGITFSTTGEDFTTPIPSQFEEPSWFGPDGARRPLWRWLPQSNGRHRGIGKPLERESWMNRPFQVSPFGGAFVSDDPLKGRINGSTGYLTGFRLGWDLDYFYGLETRFGFTSVGLDYTGGGAQLGYNKMFLMDTALMYYPLGDSKWRPYGSLGLGFGDFRFYDEFAQFNHATTFLMPFGGGLKYRHDAIWAIRFDVLDYLSFDGGRQTDTMHNLVIAGAIEARLGFGPRRSYFPWNPSRAWY